MEVTENTENTETPTNTNPTTSPQSEVASQSDSTSTSIILRPAAASLETTQGTTQEPPAPAPCAGTLELVIRDSHGDPIPNLSFKVLIKNQVVFNGASDVNGRIQAIESLKIGSVFEIQVKNDIGSYKRVAIGKIESEEIYACLTSPKTHFEFSTYVHTGEPGNATAHKQKVIKNHNQQPVRTPSITGNAATKLAVQNNRSDAGHPVAAVIDGAANWYNIHNDKAPPPPQDASTRLHTLIAFMERQATLDYTKLGKITSDEIITRMRKKTFAEPAIKLPKQSKGWCTKYVKVGLWYAGYGPATESIGSGVSPARLMGPELVKAGFKDISDHLPKVKINAGSRLIEQPDITFALPGDVIVYKKTGAPNEAGHIDVRTYHGFVSDFVWPGRNGFPDVRAYMVLGVYRKYADTIAESRVRAFLRIIREHEAKGFSDAYHALKWDGKHHICFTDMSEHPSNRVENKPAGAYQIKWNTLNKVKEETGWPDSFTPIDQDRAAIYLLQSKSNGAAYPRRTALGYLMEGKVEQAVNDTKLWGLFAFLPGGGKQQLISMDKLKQSFDAYVEEYSK